MEDITAILFHYHHQSALHKALDSIQRYKHRIEKVIVINDQKGPLNDGGNYSWWENAVHFTLTDEDINIFDNINSTYVLFLQNEDYINPAINLESFLLNNPKRVYTTTITNRDITIKQPVLVPISLLKKEWFYSTQQIPFKEAILPALLSHVNPASQLHKQDMVKQTRKNSSANSIQKAKFVQKYQLKKIKNDNPSIAILISNYNMGKYIETAIASCQLQRVKPNQVLVIDDGSTDNSIQQLKKWEQEENIQLFQKRNGGKARALNVLLQHVKSDYILELDADDWLDPDAIYVIKKHLSEIPADTTVLYGNFRKWKQIDRDVLFKGVAKGYQIQHKADLLKYRFPLGPRIYHTPSLKGDGGFPVVDFEDGRLYEDVSVLHRLNNNGRFCYRDFTVYNVREHSESITKKYDAKWNDFLNTLK